MSQYLANFFQSGNCIDCIRNSSKNRFSQTANTVVKVISSRTMIEKRFHCLQTGHKFSSKNLFWLDKLLSF